MINFTHEQIFIYKTIIIKEVPLWKIHKILKPQSSLHLTEEQKKKALLLGASVVLGMIAYMLLRRISTAYPLSRSLPISWWKCSLACA